MDYSEDGSESSLKSILRGVTIFCLRILFKAAEQPSVMSVSVDMQSLNVYQIKDDDMFWDV